MLASLGCCAVSLLLQIVEINHRVTIQDFSALMDTTGALVDVAAALVAVTIVLNALAAILTKKHQ